MPTLNKIKDALTPESTKEQTRVAKVKDDISRLEKNRKKWEYKWREAGEFIDGRHFVVFNKTRGVLESMRPKPGMVYRVNHISWKKKREMVNTILMNDPRWKVLPSPEAVEDAESMEDYTQVMKDARRIKQWLDELYKDNHLKMKMANVVDKALTMPYAGIWVEPEAKPGDSRFEVLDAFDILIEGDAEYEEDLPSITKIFKRNIYELKSNPLYKHTEGLEEDGKMAGSQLKSDRNKDKFASGSTDGAGTVICYEKWKRCYLNDDLRKKIIELDIKEDRYKKEKIEQPPQPVMDDMGLPISDPVSGEYITEPVEPVDSLHWCEELEDGYPVMYKTVTTQDCDYFHLEEYIDFPVYPCAIYSFETGAFFKPSLVERLMSPNKSLDVLQSRAEEYASMAGGRMQKSENTTVSRVDTEMGTMMEYSGSTPPTWESAPPLPPELLNRINDLKGEIADMTVVGGNVAEVAHNGRGQGAMESIKSSDMASVKTPIDALADFLDRLVVIILTQADYYMDKAETVRRIDPINDTPDYFKVIGERYSKTEAFAAAYRDSKNPPIPLSPSTVVKVEIEPGIALTSQAKFDMLMEMFNTGVVDNQTVLEQANFENISDIIGRTDKKAQLMSMIETPDFQALDPDVQLSALDNAMGKNIDMPRDPRSMGRDIGTAKKIHQGGRAG